MNTLYESYKNCTLCPRNCGVNRALGQTGFCKETSVLRGARAALHMWEEPCISGSNGSGTVFFSGCNLGCIFCQNEPISNSSIGKEITIERLVEIFFSLEEQRANNINLVTPSHFVPQIAKAITSAKQQGIGIPFLYNTGSYEKVETLHMLDGLIDIYMPDLKFYSPAISKQYANAPDYFSVACEAIAEMYRQVGANDFRPESEAVASDSENEEALIMTKGLLVRHLLLPGLEKDAFSIIKYLFETYGSNIYMSIMSQYTPMSQVANIPSLNQAVNRKVYNQLLDDCIALGVENAFIQEEDVASESFIPLFDYEGL